MNKNNLKILIKALDESPIDSHYLKICILCVVYKETGGFELARERGYARTSNKRIRAVFGSKRVGHLTDAALTALKRIPEKFFDLVYGPGGWKYRGGGFNHLTFKSNYKLYSTPKYDLVENPELINVPWIAAEVCAKFFNRVLRKQEKRIRKLYPFLTSRDCALYEGAIWSHEEGIAIAAHINAGIGKRKSNSALLRAIRNASKHINEMTNAYWEVV